MEYVRIRLLIDQILLQPDSPDSFLWRWTPSGSFTTGSAYNAFFLGQIAVPGARELWQVRAPNKCRFFVWLLLHGRAWTADRLRRHGLQDHDLCTLCSQGAETIDHLFLQCPFSREVWFKVLRKCGWQGFAPQNTDLLIAWWLQVRKSLQKQRRKGFDSLFTLTVWCLWLERNARVFRHQASLASVVIHGLWTEMDLWCTAKLVDRSQIVISA